MKKYSLKIWLLVPFAFLLLLIYAISPTQRVNASSWKFAPVAARNITYYQGYMTGYGVCDCDNSALQQWKKDHQTIDGSVSSLYLEKISSDPRCGYSSVALIPDFQGNDQDKAESGMRIISEGESGYTPHVETGGLRYIYDKPKCILYIAWSTN
jgi:hypothetical protein